MLSFIIPAHNEEALLAETLRALRAAAGSTAEPFELIVVDDASTDLTAEIAKAQDVTLVSVNLRQISAVRNAGAKLAHGEWLFFVDADTVVPKDTLAAAVACLRGGAIGGGARIRLDAGVPLWGRVLTSLITWVYFGLRLAPGCFLFVRREAFDATGGFDETYFAGEEAHLSRALKRLGRFVIVPQSVITSGRKFRVFSPWAFLAQVGRILRGGWASTRRREGLGLWYEAPREKVDSV